MHLRVFHTVTICCFLAASTVLTPQAIAQTSCAAEHPQPGAFICYPDQPSAGKPPHIPTVFHLSAQGNATAGQTIKHYVVRMDGRLIYENRLYSDLNNLSIETNLKAPFDSGSHTLTLAIDGAGAAEVKDIKVSVPEYVSLCNPFSRFDGRACIVDGSPHVLEWKGESGQVGSFDAFVSYAKLYERNLKSIEADTADAMAVDAQGRLYVASHAFSEVELREYATNGSIIYDSMMHSCGDGFLSVEGLAIDGRGRAWIAGNTNACLLTNPHPASSEVKGDGRRRAFVIEVDTTKPGSTPPLSVKYLSDVESRVTGIRLDEKGNAYVSGVTPSAQFPHDSLLHVDDHATDTNSKELSFVSMLKAETSAVEWSALLPGTLLTALALDAEGNVFVTGRFAEPDSSASVFVAELSEHGRRLSYAARLDGVANAEGRSISIGAKGDWLAVAGETEEHKTSQTFLAALRLCGKTAVTWRLSDSLDGFIPAIAIQPSLDMFASAFGNAKDVRPDEGGKVLKTTVLVGPHCSGERSD